MGDAYGIAVQLRKIWLTITRLFIYLPNGTFSPKENDQIAKENNEVIALKVTSYVSQKNGNKTQRW